MVCLVSLLCGALLLLKLFVAVYRRHHAIGSARSHVGAEGLADDAE
jgi:hypothetical protein